jgi:hypothetical protein
MDLATARAIVQQYYNTYLLRDPEEPTWTVDAEAMVAGTFTPSDLYAEILASPEYAALQAGPAPPAGGGSTGGGGSIPVPPVVQTGPAIVVGPAPTIHSASDYASLSFGSSGTDFGGGFGGLIGGIISGIASLFGGNNDSAEISAINDRLSNLGNFVLQAIGALTNQVNYNTGSDQIGGNLWAKIFGGILGPIVGLFSGLIHGVSGDLSKLLGPLSSALGKLRDQIRHIYDAWLRPILRVIDTTRQILRVLAALHLQWAAAADAALGKLEGKLTAPLLLATKKINELSNQVNRIVTLDGALQRVTLLQSLVKHAGCVQRALDSAPLAPPGTYPDKLAVDDPAQLFSDTQDALEQYADDGTGLWADYNADWLETLDTASVG